MTQVSKYRLTEADFSRLYEECREKFVIIACSYIHDRTAAEDIVSESFARLWNHRDELETEAVKTYLFRTVVRASLDYLKSAEVRLRSVEGEKSGLTPQMARYEYEALERCNVETLFTSEVEQLMQQALAKMPALTRDIFLAHRFGDKSYREIAEERQITIRRVTTEIQNALRLLREALKDYTD